MSRSLVVTSVQSVKVVYFKLAAVSMIWGGTFVAGRFLSADISPLLTASLRFLLASAVLLLFIGVARVPLKRPTVRQCLQLLVLSFFGIFFYNLCFFYGLQHINASRASLIVALNPAVIGIASWLLFKQALSRARIVGIGLAIAGATWVIAYGNLPSTGKGDEPWRGDLLILGCVLGWGIYSVFSSSLTRALGALQTVTYSIVLGTGMLWFATLWRGEVNIAALINLEATQWLSLGYLGAIGSALAYIWYYQGIEQIGATRAGVFIALNPLTAVLLGAILLGEQLNAGMAAGGSMILLGIYLCNRPSVGK